MENDEEIDLRHPTPGHPIEIDFRPGKGFEVHEEGKPTKVENFPELMNDIFSEKK